MSECPGCGADVVSASSNNPSLAVLSCGCIVPAARVNDLFQNMTEKPCIPVIRRGVEL